MEVTPTEIDEILRLLAETPRRIAAVSDDLSGEQLNLEPDSKSWSANDILAHLRACADVWGETIEAMLTKDEPVLKHISPRTWMKRAEYPQLAFSVSFQAFVEQRDDLLQTLNDPDFAGWSRGAMIKNRRHTVFSQARRMALHEVTHCEQIEALTGNFDLKPGHHGGS
jgi:uncharacterized damage-inducible protein DinB